MKTKEGKLKELTMKIKEWTYKMKEWKIISYLPRKNDITYRILPPSTTTTKYRIGDPWYGET